VAIIITLGTTAPAHAFRPFLSEDAAVLTPRDFEIEFGILEISHQPGDLISGHPLQLEAGLVKNWELILRGELQTIFKDGQISWNNSLVNMASTDLLIKGVLREGSLRSSNEWIPSIALMAGPLFPTSRGDRKIGFQGTAIASGKMARTLYHLNVGGLLDKSDSDPGIIWGLVLEYMMSDNFLAVWEIDGKGVENHIPDNSTLVGMIWTFPSSRVSIDIAGRFGLTDPAPDWLVTLGITFAFSVL